MSPPHTPMALWRSVSLRGSGAVLQPQQILTALGLQNETCACRPQHKTKSFDETAYFTMHFYVESGSIKSTEVMRLFRKVRCFVKLKVTFFLCVLVFEFINSFEDIVGMNIFRLLFLSVYGVYYMQGTYNAN